MTVEKGKSGDFSSSDVSSCAKRGISFDVTCSTLSLKRSEGISKLLVGTITNKGGYSKTVRPWWQTEERQHSYKWKTEGRLFLEGYRVYSERLRESFGGRRRTLKHFSNDSRRKGGFSRTFPQEFPNKRVAFPKKLGTSPEQTQNTSRKNLPRTSKKYGMNAGIVWGISR
jgi:hypothetical protein